LAGGYAVIHHKGETIVGVAIATALMPPLAVVGYGLATAQWGLTKGAMLLFMTNLLAIALSVTALAKWYGFGSRHSPRHTIWQTILILGVFGALSVPLGVALQNIASKTYIAKTAQAILNEKAEAYNTHISQFNISFPENKPALISATLLTKKYLPDADKILNDEMAKRLGQPIQLNIDQIIVAHAESVRKDQQIVVASNPLAAPVTSLTPPAATVTTQQKLPDEALVTYAKEALKIPVKAQQVDTDTKTITLIMDRALVVSDKSRRAMEKDIATRFPEWTTKLVSELSEITQPTAPESPHPLP
jgi:NACalpha-BTF3-like transcription factor